MKRNDLVEEMLLRENVRKIIRIVKERQAKEKKKELMAEQMIRKVIRGILAERAPVPDEIPNRSTGINVLEDLLKEIIPQLETSFKSLTTNFDQKTSFRAHVLNAWRNLIDLANMNASAGMVAIAEDVDIDVGRKGDFGDDENIIDIEEKEVDPMDDFTKGLEDADLDKTGRNVAFNVMKKIQQNILDKYELLGDPSDRDVFDKYGEENVDKYLDKFLDEMSPELPVADTQPLPQDQEQDQEQLEDAEAEL